MTDNSASVQLPSPFVQNSWEPRFAIDLPYITKEFVSLGLECYLASSAGFISNRSDFSGYIISPTRFVIKSPTASFPRFEEPEFSGYNLKMTAEGIRKWLEEEAQYPKQPWFDGGESRGFQMYHVPWQSEPKEFYGYAIVEPKWFETHK